jgi:transposase InsO family protein
MTSGLRPDPSAVCSSAKAFLEEAVAAFPFRVTRLLTDRGSCFTAEGFEKRCRELGIEHRKTKPYTPRTNGMVERFNGRVQREVLGITGPCPWWWCRRPRAEPSA